MIGGHDIHVRIKTRPSDAAFVLAELRSLWPHALYHDADSDTPRPIHDLPAGTERVELLVYENERMFQSWQRDGATAGNADAMVHLIVRPESITVVVGTKESPVATRVHEILEALELAAGVRVESTGADDALFKFLVDVPVDAADAGPIHTLPRKAA